MNSQPIVGIWRCGVVLFLALTPLPAQSQVRDRQDRGGATSFNQAAYLESLSASSTDDLSVSCIPDGLFLCFPVARLADDPRSAASEQVVGKDLLQKLSPLRRVTKSWPSTVLFFGNADRLLPGGILLYDKAREMGVTCELCLAEGRGHGFVNASPWNFVSSKCAADFFMRAGVLPRAALPDTPPGMLKKYNDEPLEAVYLGTDDNPARQRFDQGGGHKQSEPAASEELGSSPQPSVAQEKTTPQLTSDRLQQVLRRFPEADLNKDGKLSLEEAREYLRKADRNSQSKTLASAQERFETGRWYMLMLENKGNDLVAQIEGKKPLRAESKDVHVKKPGIEFRVAGRENIEVGFDSLRVWELK
jgi:hypothetical protein